MFKLHKFSFQIHIFFIFSFMGEGHIPSDMPTPPQPSLQIKNVHDKSTPVVMSVNHHHQSLQKGTQIKMIADQICQTSLTNSVWTPQVSLINVDYEIVEKEALTLEQSGAI